MEESYFAIACIYREPPLCNHVSGFDHEFIVLYNRHDTVRGKNQHCVYCRDAPMAQSLKTAFVIDRLGLTEVQSVAIIGAITESLGHRFELIEYGRAPEQSVRELTAYQPDIVYFTLCSNEVSRYLDINRTLKQHLNYFALFGGPHPTFSPDFVQQEGVDAICRGEGDLCLPPFLERFGTEAMYEVSNFTFRVPGDGFKENPLGPLVEDLDSLPFPLRECLFKKSPLLAENPIKGFSAGRGCPYRCTYCFNARYNRMYEGKGRIARVKSVSYLIEEIRQVKENYPLKFIKFQDDTFGLKREWLTEFAERFPREIGLPFQCLVRPNIVSDEYARLLKQAGCHSVTTAIESGNQEIRNRVLDRNLSDDDIREACACLKRNSIRVYTVNIVGLPGETEENIFETIRFNQAIRPDHADATIFQPYPGTPIAEYCKEKGLIDDRTNRFVPLYAESILKIDPEFKHRIYVLHKLFPILVDFPWLTRWLPKPFYKTRIFDRFLQVLFRFWYGFFLHRRIYMSLVPLRIRLKTAAFVLFYRERV